MQKKSVCMVVGLQRKVVSASLSLHNCAFVCVEKLKYLGVFFSAGNLLTVDYSLMRQKFYGACNSLLRRSGGSELVKV